MFPDERPETVLKLVPSFDSLSRPALLELTPVAYFLVAAISGVVYACLREWTKSRHAPAIVHGIGNAYVIASETMR